MAWDPVTAQQALIANTVYRGLSGLADRPLQQSRLSLTKAQLLDEIRRNKAADERANRGLGLQEQAGNRAQQLLDIRQQEADQAQQEFQANAVIRNLQRKQAKIGLDQLLQQENLRNEPLTMDTLAPLMFGQDPSTESMMDFAANKKLQKILKATGGTYKNGRFIKRNGQVATWADLPNIMAIAQPVLQSDSDPGHALNQRIRQYEDARANGAVLAPEEEQAYQEAKAAQKNPQWLIDQYEKQNDAAYSAIAQFKQRGLSTGTLETNIARRDKKIAGLNATLTARRKQADAIELQEIKNKGSDLGSLGKDSKFLSKVSGLPLEDATNIIRYDRTMADRLRGAAEELKRIDPDNYDLTTPEGRTEMQADIDQIKKDWGLDTASVKRSQTAAKKPEEEITNDPDQIRSLLFQ